MYKIVLADDEEGVRFFFSQILEKEGYQVFTAEDGEQAKEQIEKNRPDIIILDIRMPKCDGFGVLKWLKENQDQWIPVIMLSALQDLKYVKQGYELKADHYLTKPCSKKDLLKSIRTMLSMKDIYQDTD
jgi:DNA-binding response OmpR family regulator